MYGRCSIFTYVRYIIRSILFNITNLIGDVVTVDVKQLRCKPVGYSNWVFPKSTVYYTFAYNPKLRKTCMLRYLNKHGYKVGNGISMHPTNLHRLVNQDCTLPVPLAIRSRNPKSTNSFGNGHYYVLNNHLSLAKACVKNEHLVLIKVIPYWLGCVLLDLSDYRTMCKYDKTRWGVMSN